MTQDTGRTCDDETLAELLGVAQQDTQSGIAAIEAVLREYPDDPRLHFLKGSLLIGEKRFIAAHSALSNALRLDPGYDLARFQLGFFELTSGEADAAVATWQRLKDLPEDSYLRLFVEGLEHLIADRFEPCIQVLRDGIARNQENLPLNNDMELIIARCQELTSASPGAGKAGTEEAVSATSLLLGAASKRLN